MSILRATESPGARAIREAVLRRELAVIEQKTGCRAVKEHRFHPGRRWRFDLAFPSAVVAVELDGGIFSGGRHVRPLGFLRDMEKLNHAALLGWRVFRFTWEHVHDGTFRKTLCAALTKGEHPECGFRAVI